MLKKQVLLLIAALLISTTTQAAPLSIDAEKDLSRYQAFNDVAFKTFTKLQKIYGRHWRTELILVACGKTGLARALNTTSGNVENIGNALSATMDESKADISSDLPVDSFLWLHSTINAMIVSYKAGFQSALQITMIGLDNTGLCNASVALADELLNSPNEKSK